MKLWLFLFSFLMVSQAAFAFEGFDDIDEAGVTTILKAGTHVKAGANYSEPSFVDISGENPVAILTISTFSFKHGVPDYLQNHHYHPKPSDWTSAVYQTADAMAKVFRTGSFHLPKAGDLQDQPLKGQVNMVYDYLLSDFDWHSEKDYSTNITAEDVALVLVTRARIERLKALWK